MVKKNSTSLKNNLMSMSEISIVIDNYDDIFSDFDPRAYSERALSDDFLLEAKKASRDKAKGSIELNFLIKKELRNIKHEHLIRKRLREHFKKHFNMALKEIHELIKKGILFIGIGIIAMFLASYMLHEYPVTTIFINFIIIVLEPAGWFFFWEGLRQVIFEPKTKKPESDFYDKMSRCKINFLSY